VASKAIHTPVSTIEETSKRLKLHIIISALMFWGGIIFFIAGNQGDTPTTAGILGALSFFAGMVW
jgi:hypothetical protein